MEEFGCNEAMNTWQVEDAGIERENKSAENSRLLMEVEVWRKKAVASDFECNVT